jgi:acyl dehydratase
LTIVKFIYCIYFYYRQIEQVIKEYVVMVDQSKIGQSFPPFNIEVERGKIHELALALDDDNPIYHSRDAAQAAGYTDVPLFPTFPTVLTFWGNTHMMEHMVSLGIDVKRVLHGEEEFEYLAPITPGDRLTGVMTLVDATTKKGQGNTSMDIFTLEMRYTNQHDLPVLRVREVVIVRA